MGVLHAKDRIVIAICCFIGHRACLCLVVVAWAGEGSLVAWVGDDQLIAVVDTSTRPLVVEVVVVIAKYWSLGIIFGG